MISGSGTANKMWTALRLVPGVQRSPCTKRNFAPNTMSVSEPGSMSPENHNQWSLSKVETLIN